MTSLQLPVTTGKVHPVVDLAETKWRKQKRLSAWARSACKVSSQEQKLLTGWRSCEHADNLCCNLSSDVHLYAFGADIIHYDETHKLLIEASQRKHTTCRLKNQWRKCNTQRRSQYWRRYLKLRIIHSMNSTLDQTEQLRISQQFCSRVRKEHVAFSICVCIQYPSKSVLKGGGRLPTPVGVAAVLFTSKQLTD